MFDIGKIESKIEKQESVVEELEQSKEANENRIEALQKGIERIKEDKEIIKILEKNKEAAEKEHKKLDKKVEKCVSELEDCVKQIDKELTTISNERGTISELEMMGEDVSEAKDILTNREDQLEEKREEIQALAERLGATISDSSLDGTTSSGKKRFKDRCMEVLVCVEMLLNVLNPAGEALAEPNTPKEFPQDRPATVQKVEMPETLEDALIDLGQYLEHLPDEYEYYYEKKKDTAKEQGEKVEEMLRQERYRASQRPLD